MASPGANVPCNHHRSLSVTQQYQQYLGAGWPGRTILMPFQSGRRLDVVGDLSPPLGERGPTVDTV